MHFPSPSPDRTRRPRRRAASLRPLAAPSGRGLRDVLARALPSLAACGLPFLATCGLLSLAACGSTRQAVTPPWPPLESAELGQMVNVSVAGGVWSGGTPDAQDLDLAARRGVRQVIAVCPVEAYGDLDLVGTCDRLGLELHELGPPAEERLADAAVERAVGLLGRENRPPTLVFCETGTRAALVVAVHRVLNDGVDLEQALLDGRRAGLGREDGESRVRTLVARLRARED